MSMQKIATLALGLLLSGTLAAHPAVDKAKVAEAIKADVHLLVAQFNARDVEKAVAHDTPNYVGMFHGMPNVNGAAEDMAVTKQQVSDPAANVAVSNEKVDVADSGEMAVYRATYAYRYTDPATKQPTTEHGNWLMGYQKQADGSWKLTWGVISDTGPGAAK
jgi:ketosteroid isomerase-like protein